MASVPIRILFAAVVLLGVVLPLQLYFGGNWYSLLHGYSLGMVLGIGAYWYGGIAMLLALRLPFLDRLYGQDRLMQIHGRVASLAIGCGVAHLLFKLDYSDSSALQTRLGFLALLLFVLVGVVAHLLMVHGPQHALGGLDALRRRVLRTVPFDYSRLKLFHNAAALAWVVVTLHLLLATSTAESALRLWGMGALGAVVTALYLYHKVGRLLLLRRRALVVRELRYPLAGVFQLELQSSSGRPFFHRAGQFCYLRLWSKRCGIEEHPFTISSAPGRSTLELTIKALGDYTARLKEVEPGTMAFVDGPYGRFTPPFNQGPTLFIAGGIGVTPFLSILGEWQRHTITQPIILVWSCATTAELFAAEQFYLLARQQPAFTFVPVVTREQPPVGGFGRITPELIAQVLAGYKPQSVQAWICCSPPLFRLLKGALRGLGLSAGQIHSEDFSL
jgi:predicted ferric reductase